MDNSGITRMNGSRFPDLVFFILVFAVVGGCGLRRGRGRLLVCGCCCCCVFFFFSPLMWFVVVASRGNGGGVVAVVFF